MKIFGWAKRLFKKAATFLVQVRSELKKVVWPSASQVRVFTVVVITTIIGVGAILWSTDGLLAFVLGRFIGK